MHQISPQKETYTGMLEHRNNLLLSAIYARNPETNVEWIELFTLLKFLMWWFDAGETPVLIPNTAVKPCSTDGIPFFGRE